MTGHESPAWIRISRKPYGLQPISPAPTWMPPRRSDGDGGAGDWRGGGGVELAGPCGEGGVGSGSGGEDRGLNLVIR